MFMLQLREVYALPLERHPSGEWIKLIRKLRWIGMDEEAQRLQRAVSTLPPDERAAVVADPFGTD
jgi:DNA-directed RNA polymerase specialized sigma24 family protein